MAEQQPVPSSAYSIKSFSSFQSGDEEDERDNNSLNASDSSAALILVHEGEDYDNDFAHSFSFTSDEDDEYDDENQFDHSRSLPSSSSTPILSSSAAFLYLLAPLLKLGAILAVDESGALPVKWAIPALLVFAVLCAFTRQIWYMLAKYVRRADMEEILLQAFARKRGNEKGRRLVRIVVRFSVGAFRVLLATVFLRASVDVLLPLLPETLIIPTRYPLTILIALFIVPICFAKSIGATVVLYATWISVATFVAWEACTAYAHAKGILMVNPAGDSLGTLWQGISVIAFAFTTSYTLPLYAALRDQVQPGVPKPKRASSFRFLSLMSVGLATALILPLIFFEASSAPRNTQAQTYASSPSFKFLVALLNASTLTLTIPLFLISAPPLPLPLSLRRRTSLPVSKLLLWFVTVGLAVAPERVARVLSDVVLVSAFGSTYVLPAFIHIVMHNVHRPLSIIIPASAPITPNPTHTDARVATPMTSSTSRDDELLQRKERTLQRRRLTRRIVWDIGVWVLLVPVGGGGLVWAGGRIAGRW